MARTALQNRFLHTQAMIACRLALGFDPLIVSRGQTPDILNFLSDELLLEVVKYVGCSKKEPKYGGIAPNGPKRLLNLAQCSRRLHRITIPVLYSHFRQSESGGSKALPQFMCRIFATPELASCVQVYHCAARDSQWDDNSLDMSAVGEQDWDRITQALNKTMDFNEEATEAWLSSIKAGDWDAITALLISTFPNLEELEFDSWSYTDEVYPRIIRTLTRAKEMQDRGETGPLAMPKLRRVSLEYWDTENGLTIRLLLPFLKIPSVRTFYGRMIEDENVEPTDDGNPNWFNAGLAFQTKRLYMYHSSIDLASLALFLNCFPSLEIFHYKNGAAGYASFEPPRLMAALQPLKPTLQELRVLDEEQHGIANFEGYPLGSLTEFTKLRHIDVNSTMMIGLEDPNNPGASDVFPQGQILTDAVPQSLEILRLRGCGVWVPLPMLDLIEHKETYCPLLTYVDLGWEKILYPDKPSPKEPYIHPGFTKDEAVKLLKLCEEKGVMMHMTVEPPKAKHVGYRDAGKNTRLTRWFEYPYDGYEEFCREHGCNLETGWQP
ncbi:hypothetical protein G7Y89_g8859 [Cudoniella acicularis]|uniref:Leucine-rich repeat domain-containing protein n=1 Tax=Cudoniella acicularis TaxID=354080 RepID=A0A8H4RHZ5_9HELO|nr:hypothetical protein G7Y89_g8859 [Cudoniella acicularis]